MGWCALGEVPLQGLLSICGVEPGVLEGGGGEEEGEGLVDQAGTLPTLKHLCCHAYAQRAGTECKHACSVVTLVHCQAACML